MTITRSFSMSSAKVRTFKQIYGYTATSTGGVTTITTTTTNYLVVGDVVSFRFDNSPQEINSVAIASIVTPGTVFTVSDPQAQIQSVGFVEVAFFSTGQTGGMPWLGSSRTGATTAIIQSTITGTGGATYTIEGSLDGVHWSTLATVTHATTSGDTQYTQNISTIWAYVRLNFSVIGAASEVQARISS